ncbi:MAG: protease complex subunit PrcB family protein [Candidatus Thiodiazotropha taylori]|nr:protease complex subunit PrcB family protein [Candidatus Thiodiazotropha taylori]MCW4224755.1 protease complex subunit PrcB family protein [Candidatus Thiodiazotropha endolucinida]MCG7886328.1 protease complex subunit PrcB family protein [Candidatus Thiodiazotropha taylori]MCG7891207.1 protease complex subunit PrcB family protein [Candidatus Thiodiazotropha taylori]MCG8033635.1 protease complex subunit PrcB family protein [Candidatus Thiodiazotropha taylori]
MLRYKMQYDWKRLIGLGLILLVSSGCNTMASSSVSVLKQGYVCSVNQPAGLQLVSDAVAKQADSARIGVDTPQKDADTSLDPEQFWIVRVNMGQQPSGGYALRLISDQLEISSDTARVALEWLQPKPGSVQIQALTYPCLYLKIARDNYSRLEIVDQEGVVRHHLSLN